MIFKSLFGGRRGGSPSPAPAAPAASAASSASAPAALPQDTADIEALLRDGRAEEALARVDARLADDAASAELNRLAGEAHLRLGTVDEAIDFFDLALHHDPESDQALAGLIRCLRRLGREHEVRGTVMPFLERNPKSAAGLFEAALLEEGAGRPVPAIDLLERLLAAHPDHVEGMNLLGLLRLREEADIDAAEPLLRAVLERVPGHLAATANLGWVLGSRGRIHEALACFERVLAHAPGDTETRLMRALALLKNGEWAQGWDDYGVRRDAKTGPEQPYAYPEWSGGVAPDGALLVVHEQGLGDQVMFASCIHELCERVPRVILECSPRLVPLFARSFPATRVIGRAPAGPPVDLTDEVIGSQVLMGDLPRMFRRTATSFPHHAGYLETDRDTVEAMTGRLTALGAGPRIGLSWRGGTRYSRTRVRSFGLETFLPLMHAVPGRYVSLQYGDVTAELAEASRAAPREIAHWQDAIDDLDLTASLIRSLDVVVTVCTTVAHMAGALGKPCLVLTPMAPEWRYGVSGTTMPWYPSVRLFRQTRPGDWSGVVDAVTDAVRALR
jgi:tetratricopeptide (TPR) repeat protein